MQKNNTKKGLPLIAWDKICMPKSKGGLGLCKTDAVDKAFQCKLVWKVLTNEESASVRLMQAKYRRNKEFLQYDIKRVD